MEAMKLVRDIVKFLVREDNDLNKSSNGVDEKGSFWGCTFYRKPAIFAC